MSKTFVTTRKGAFTSNRVDNQSTSTKEKCPVTLSEKFTSFEKKFAAAIAEIAQLKTEVEATKEQLADAKIEIADTKKENAALLAQVVLCDQQMKIISAELRELKKEIPAKDVNAGGKTAGDAGTFHLAVLRKLPCKDVDELKLLIADIWDPDTLIYIENRLGQIGGSDLKICITRILDRLMSKELQRDMCLTGKRTTKDGLMGFPQIMDLIHNAVRHTFPNYKDKDGEPIIGKTLQK